MRHKKEQAIHDDHLVDFFFELYSPIHILHFPVCKESLLAFYILIAETIQSHINAHTNKQEHNFNEDIFDHIHCGEQITLNIE